MPSSIAHGDYRVLLSAGAVYQRPFANGAIGMDAGLIIDGQRLMADSASRNPIVNWEEATPDYFRAMDIRLPAGQALRRAGHGEVAAGGHHRAVARRASVAGAECDRPTPDHARRARRSEEAVWQTVVGVVEDARYREVETPRFDLYLPYRQAPNQVQHFMVRLSGDPRAALSALRSTIAALDPDARIDGISTMDDVVGRAFAPWRFSSIVVSAFAAIGLMFAAVGIASAGGLRGESAHA